MENGRFFDNSVSVFTCCVLLQPTNFGLWNKNVQIYI